MKYDSDTLREIEENVDLIEYAQAEMELIKRGKDYFTQCPLHTDRTPSLSFVPDKNFFYCHSCGVGGKIIKYLEVFENLAHEEAIEKAAKLAKMDLSKMCRSETILWLKQLRTKKKQKNMSVKEKDRKILSTKEFDKYKKVYPEEWLNEGILPEVMDKFEIVFDENSNRILYPVYDNDDNLINFKGRTLNPLYKELGIAKYISYYHIGTIDYFQGLRIAKEEIKKKKEVIIFESIKSVMKCHGWGFRNCVSMESHGMTEEQLKILIKLQADVVFAFDSDVDLRSKECKKLRKTIRKLKSYLNVSVIVDEDELLGGKEAKNSPADCGKDIFETLYKNRLNWIDYDN